MELKTKYQYTYFIKPFLIKEINSSLVNCLLVVLNTQNNITNIKIHVPYSHRVVLAQWDTDLVHVSVQNAVSRIRR